MRILQEKSRAEKNGDEGDDEPERRQTNDESGRLD
jgi:hypothetical protein